MNLNVKSEHGVKRVGEMLSSQVRHTLLIEFDNSDDHIIRISSVKR